MWVRGLKRQNCGRSVPRYTKVAPRVGAWIETTGHGGVRLGDEVAPRVGAWIETNMEIMTLHVDDVAPRVGAWIETYPPPLYYIVIR